MYDESSSEIDKLTLRLVSDIFGVPAQVHKERCGSLPDKKGLRSKHYYPFHVLPNSSLILHYKHFEKSTFL
jgi:hypothetical protein